jgi:hypothetical protein
MEYGENLLEIIDNKKFEVLYTKNTKTINTIKNNILQKLQLSSVELKNFHKKLKEYQYVDELPDIHVGHYVRWIPLSSSIAKLTNGGIIVETNINETGVYILVKNNIGRIYMIYIDKILLFQKITVEERIIINIMDYLET